MNNNPGQSASNRTQAFCNLAALVEDAAGQQGPHQHMTRVHNALVALQNPQLHHQWRDVLHNVTTTQKAARDSAQQAELAQQQRQPQYVQQYKSDRARDDAGKANDAIREQAKFEDDVLRSHQKAIAQFLEPHGVPVYHPVPLVGHQNVHMNDANPEMPPPEQDPTIAQQLAAIDHLQERFERAYRQGEEGLATLRAQHAVAVQLEDDQQKIIEQLVEIRNQNRGGVADGVPIRIAGRGGANPVGRAHRGPPKQEVVHNGKVVGMGQAFNPVTGHYTFFACTTAACPYTTGNRQNIYHHCKTHHKE